MEANKAHMLEEVYEEMQEEGELTNDKLKRLRWENQVKEVRQKESLNLLLLQRPVRLLLFILVCRYSLFL